MNRKKGKLAEIAILAIFLSLKSETMSPLHVRSKVCMAPFYMRSKVCIAPIHVGSKLADFAPHGSKADFVPHMEGSHADFVRIWSGDIGSGTKKLLKLSILPIVFKNLLSPIIFWDFCDLYIYF